ncbi:cupin domain-containing protein [Spirosoma luteolum]
MLVTAQPFFVAQTDRFPNSVLPVLRYQGLAPAATPQLDNWFAERLTANNWLGIWRNGIYTYDHYHSTSHEVLCVYAGWVELQLGGDTGPLLTLHAGDVVVLPAGVAHCNQLASHDLGVLGAYPGGRSWDLLKGLPGERPAADERIRQVPLPDSDPFFGPGGALVALWSSRA